MMKTLYSLVAVCFMLASNIMIINKAEAAIYKCVKVNGKVFYNDKPCPSKDVETTLKHAKEPKNRYISETPKAKTIKDAVPVKKTKASADKMEKELKHIKPKLKNKRKPKGGFSEAREREQNLEKEVRMRHLNPNYKAPPIVIGSPD